MKNKYRAREILLGSKFSDFRIDKFFTLFLHRFGDKVKPMFYTLPDSWKQNTFWADWFIKYFCPIHFYWKTRKIYDKKEHRLHHFSDNRYCHFCFYGCQSHRFFIHFWWKFYIQIICSQYFYGHPVSQRAIYK